MHLCPRFHPSFMLACLFFGACGSSTKPVVEAGASAPAAEASATSLEELAGKRYEYSVDCAWQRPSSAREPSAQPLPEAEYSAVAPTPRYEVVFSPDGGSVTLSALVAGEGSLTGERSADVGERWSYELSAFAGGVFQIWREDAALHAELTIYGSGLPVVESTRGLLSP